MGHKLIINCASFAMTAYDGLKDKGGQDYVEHPIQVSKILQEMDVLDSEELDIAIGIALLHDVIEDTQYTPSDFYSYGIPDDVVQGVLIMTRRDGESYMDYVRRCSENKITRYVKMADLKHNMDLTRLDKITDEDLRRVKKYHKAYKYLEKKD